MRKPGFGAKLKTIAHATFEMKNSKIWTVLKVSRPGKNK